jgi:hypothetical protein
MNCYSDGRVAGIPGISYPLNFFDEVWAIDFERSIRFGPARVMLIRNIEGIPEELDICRL